MKIKIIEKSLSEYIQFSKGRKKRDGFLDSVRDGMGYVWDLWGKYDEVEDRCPCLASGRAKTYEEALKALAKEAKKHLEGKK